MTRRLSGSTADGEWAVLDADSNPLPGRWPSERAARDHGLLGAYLLSGYEVARVGAVSLPDAKIVSPTTTGQEPA